MSPNWKSSPMVALTALVAITAVWGGTFLVVQDAVKRMPVTIYRYDVGGALASTWPIVDAYPVKWVGEPLQADGREAAVETLEIAFGGKLPSGGTVQRVAAEGATQPGAAGDAQGGGALAGSEVQRQLAQKVVELLKDAMRVERERAGKSGSY